MSITNLQKIHNNNFEKEVFELMNYDLRELSQKKIDFIKTNCPACEAVEFTKEYDLFGLDYCRCTKCKTIYLNPCPNEDLIVWFLNNSRALHKWREEMPGKVIRTRKKTLYKSRVDFILRQLNEYSIKPLSLVDIGGGNGYLIEEIHSREIFKKLIVIEPQPLDIVLSNVEIINSTFEDYYPNTRHEVVVSFEVLEHIFNPQKFLVQVNNCLKDDGLFIFSTPNIDGFETSTLGKISRACWFDHIRLYNPKSLKLLLDRAGFEIIKLETPGELDVQIVVDEYLKGSFYPENNPALKFILENRKKCHVEFQQYLINNNLSSHMRCVARKK